MASPLAFVVMMLSGGLSPTDRSGPVPVRTWRKAFSDGFSESSDREAPSEPNSMDIPNGTASFGGSAMIMAREKNIQRVREGKGGEGGGRGVMNEGHRNDARQCYQTENKPRNGSPSFAT
jgi:hypothetical protein